MNNFRQHPAKVSFANRNAQQGSEMPTQHPWMSEMEISSMRRQNPPYNSVMHNMAPNVQSPLLNPPHMLSAQSKNYENSCKMPSSNFTHSPGPDVFKQLPTVNESNYNRFSGDRFSSNNSFPNVNMQYKMNEGPMYKDFPGPNAMGPLSRKNEVFATDVSKPLYSNVRQPQERFSCMQNDQSQFNSKFDNSQIFQSKGFPFSNEKELTQTSVPYCDKISNAIGNNFAYKPNYKAPSLFPAYTPKDSLQESPKTTQHSEYSPDLAAKSSTFCDKIPVSSRQPKSIQPFQEKILAEKERSLQEKNLENAINELLQQNASLFDKHYKSVSNSQVLDDSFKELMDTVSSNNKFPFLSENQQSCLQTPNEVTFQRTQSMQISNHSNTISSKDCFMQSTPFSSHADQHSLKDNSSSNCSFNFDSNNLSAADIAELLPGIDLFLKETLSKNEDFHKSDISKSNSAFSEDNWAKPSIPFIGDNQTSHNNSQSTDGKDLYCEQTPSMKERYSDAFGLKAEKTNDSKLSDICLTNNKISDEENRLKDATPENFFQKTRSALEEAIEMLVTNDAIVGLDYIIEYKRNISQQGSFPFKCKLCNSAITRPMIIDHIVGPKHRLRYLKIKDESRYEYIISLKVEKSEKDAKIIEAAFDLEKIHGRGHVIVDTEEYQKDALNVQSSLKEPEIKPAEVFTLDKIPIGFEALSPQHDDMQSTSFTLEEPNVDNTNQETSNNNTQNSNESVTPVIEMKGNPCEITLGSEFTSPGFGLKPSIDEKLDSDSPFLRGSNSMDSTKKLDVKMDSNDARAQLSVETLGSSQIKRPASPDTLCRIKQQKTDEIADESKSDMLLDQNPCVVKTEQPPGKKFSLSLFEELSKCVISSDEEASSALEAINILMKVLLRYKLQHVSIESMENLMKSLQSTSPDKIEELSSLMKDSKMVENKQEEDSADNFPLKSDISLQDNSEEKVKQELTSHSESSNQDKSLPNLLTSTILDSCSTAASLLSTDASVSVSSGGINNTNFIAPQTSASVPVDNVAEGAKNALNNVQDSRSSQQSSSVGSQAATPVGLKPPPFFQWPQTNEAMPTQVSYAAVPATQNMMWTTSYQHAPAPYAQMQYYPLHGYGGAFAGNQAYQSQYPVLHQSSTPMKMVSAPPLPPQSQPAPPPLPPPNPPCNPPLPPLPNPTMFPSSAVSQSVPLPGNPPCMNPFSKPPPPPPPPLP